jgi:subtilisin family serine protease
VLRLSLTDPPFDGRTGKGVRVAVVDSGIAPNHPHVGAVAIGINLAGEGQDTSDRIGHGTAVAAAIREKAPDAELVPVRVFDRELATDVHTLGRAIVWAADHGCEIVNLSLGTSNEAHRAVIEQALELAHRRNVMVISAYETDGTKWLPGSLDGAIGVVPVPELDRELIEIDTARRELPVLVRASIYPRPIPGVPKERNLSGVSFAVANVSGFMAVAREGRSEWPLFPVT